VSRAAQELVEEEGEAVPVIMVEILITAVTLKTLPVNKDKVSDICSEVLVLIVIP
jgi:hypothetical protein